MQEPLGRPAAQAIRARDIEAQVHEISVRLGEVETQDLLEFRKPLARGPLEPHGEPLVEVRAVRLGEAVVGRVVEQDVAKTVRLRDGEGRLGSADELSSQQAGKAGGDDRTRLGRRHRDQGHLLEDLALDRGASGERSFVVRESVHACGHERLDRRRDRDSIALDLRRSVTCTLDDEAHHLRDEQRIAVGGGHDPVTKVSGQRGAARCRGDQLVRARRIQPGEVDADAWRRRSAAC